MKNIRTVFRNSPERFNIRLDQREERISKLQDNPFGVTELKENQGKRMRKSEEKPRDAPSRKFTGGVTSARQKRTCFQHWFLTETSIWTVLYLYMKMPSRWSKIPDKRLQYPGGT